MSSESGQYVMTEFIWVTDLSCHSNTIIVVSIVYLARTANLPVTSQLIALRLSTSLFTGHAVEQLVEALRYNPEGRGFDSRWCHWNFSKI